MKTTTIKFITALTLIQFTIIFPSASWLMTKGCCQSYQWAKSIGGISYDEGYSITTDASSNVFVTGYFQDTADFDPGPGTANLISAGFSDIFFAKYDANGNYLWAKQLGNTGNDKGYSITTDGTGNVLVAGYFESTADFDPGPGTANLTSAGSRDIFFAKYDTDGNYIWAKGLGGALVEDIHSITTDNTGNVLVTGYFYGTTDFDPGPGTANLTSAGDRDIFFAKYNTDGNYIWAKRIGGSSGDWGYSITTDPTGSGDVFVTGYFQDTADFDPEPGTANLISAGGEDIFFAKYDSNGDYLWAKRIGAIGYDGGHSITTDVMGNVLVTGSFAGIVDFDTGPGTATLIGGIEDVFFVKYDTDGNYIWAKRIGSDYSDYGKSITTDVTSNVLITGYFQGTVDFDPGTGTVNLTSSGSYDIFFAKYNSNGDYLWAKNIGSGDDDYGLDITTDVAGNVLVTGCFRSTADFDPGTGTATLASAGGKEIFFAKYSTGTTPGISNDEIIKQNGINLKCYPNPFDKIITIEYDLSEKANVRLEIFNIAGQKVEEVVNEDQQEGKYTYELSLDQDPSSVWFYKFTVNGVSISGKIVLVE